MNENKVWLVLWGVEPRVKIYSDQQSALDHSQVLLSEGYNFVRVSEETVLKDAQKSPKS